MLTVVVEFAEFLLLMSRCVAPPLRLGCQCSLQDRLRIGNEIAHDDRNGSENAVYMYLALKKAGVNAELHVYSEGGHGFGIRPGNAPHTSWPARVEDWMKFHKYLQAAK